RLDLFDRFARLCCICTKSTHNIKSTTDAKEALEEADLLVLQVGENCARKFLKGHRRQGFANLERASLIEQSVEDLLDMARPTALALSLIEDPIVFPRDVYRSPDWPPTLTELERMATPLQVLRWVRSEEYIFELLASNEQTPLKTWLDDPSSLPLVPS